MLLTFTVAGVFHFNRADIDALPKLYRFLIIGGSVAIVLFTGMKSTKCSKCKHHGYRFIANKCKNCGYDFKE